MSTYPIPPELAQLPLIGVDDNTGSFELRMRKKQVEVTLARIRQLRDDLNAQLSCHPGQRPSIHNPTEAAALMDCFIGALDHEELWIVNLDTRHHVMSLVKLYQGSVNSSQVRVSEVFRQAIIENAPAIVIAHNHPSGEIIPSPEDVMVTRAICEAGKLLDIEVLDHIVVAQGRYTSMKERGLGFS